MKILSEKIKGKHFIISSSIKKFTLGKKTFVKQLIKENGGTVSNYHQPEKTNVLLLGDKLDQSLGNGYQAEVMLEHELVEQPKLDLEYFPNLREKFTQMMHTLGQQPNVVFQHISIGKPMTEKEFAAVEKKLKRPLPKAMKEFYSVFGHLQILWYFRKPYDRHSLKAGRNHWNFSYYDNHKGTIQFLPLKTIAKYKWHDSEMCFGMTESMKMLDYFSEYYMTAVNIESGENPWVLLGNDHGVSFTDDDSMSLTDYVNLTFNTYGIRDRAEYFVSHFRQNVAEQRAKLEAAINAPIEFDFENKEAIEEAIKKHTEVFRQHLKAKAFDEAEEAAYKVGSADESVSRYLLIELYAIQQDEKLFFRNLEWAIKRYNFNFEYYEKQTSTKHFQDDERYLELKNAQN